MTDRNDSEYEIKEPNEKGVIFDFQDEPNCDGDEPHCFYDSQVTVKLGSGKDLNGNAVPQLSIEITVSDAWVSAFEYRSSFKDAFTQIKKDWAGEKQASKVKLLSPAQVKAEIFDKAKALAAKYKAKGPVTSKMIIEQINKIEAYVASKSKVYAYQSLRSMSLFVVDEESNIITHFDTRTTTEYAK